MIQEQRHYRLPIFAAVAVVLFKLLFLLTNHIQEDAFISWRVAQNLVDYGVIGFNGETRISASTTHLYVLVSAFFNLLFGKIGFIVPLLIFNSLLFTIGSFWLSKLLLNDHKLQAIFIILFGLLPPSIKISILGMEYGMLFFLEMAFLYYGIFQRKNWALLVLPALILFTRMDTVIFLGITFLIDLLWHKKINWKLIIGGFLGAMALLSFNWFYFNELANNTITAKQLTYDQSFTFGKQLNMFLANTGNYWGMLKIPGDFNPFTPTLLVFELICAIILLRQKKSRNLFLLIIVVFAWAKQIIFLSQRSLFDWYYWVPQILLFVPILVFVLEQKQRKSLWLGALLIFYILPMLVFQTVHSIATGNGEWNYRRNIGLFLNDYEKDKNQWIFLEPAGFVPYFSGLKTIDEVGLVDRGVQGEIIKDRKNYKVNTVKNRQPKYILAYQDLFKGENAEYYQEHYRLVKEFRIDEHLDSENRILEKIYRLKPSGTDYNLYEKIK